MEANVPNSANCPRGMRRSFVPPVLAFALAVAFAAGGPSTAAAAVVSHSANESIALSAFAGGWSLPTGPPFLCAGGVATTQFETTSAPLSALSWGFDRDVPAGSSILEVFVHLELSTSDPMCSGFLQLYHFAFGFFAPFVGPPVCSSGGDLVADYGIWLALPNATVVRNSSFGVAMTWDKTCGSCISVSLSLSCIVMNVSFLPPPTEPSETSPTTVEPAASTTEVSGPASLPSATDTADAFLSRTSVQSDAAATVAISSTPTQTVTATSATPPASSPVVGSTGGQAASSTTDSSPRWIVVVGGAAAAVVMCAVLLAGGVGLCMLLRRRGGSMDTTAAEREAAENIGMIEMETMSSGRADSASSAGAERAPLTGGPSPEEAAPYQNLSEIRTELGSDIYHNVGGIEGNLEGEEIYHTLS